MKYTDIWGNEVKEQTIGYLYDAREDRYVHAILGYGNDDTKSKLYVVCLRTNQILCEFKSNFTLFYPDLQGHDMLGNKVRPGDTVFVFELDPHDKFKKKIYPCKVIIDTEKQRLCYQFGYYRRALQYFWHTCILMGAEYEVKQSEYSTKSKIIIDFTK